MTRRDPMTAPVEGAPRRRGSHEGRQLEPVVIPLPGTEHGARARLRRRVRTVLGGLGRAMLMAGIALATIVGTVLGLAVALLVLSLPFVLLAIPFALLLLAFKHG